MILRKHTVKKKGQNKIVWLSYSNDLNIEFLYSFNIKSNPNTMPYTITGNLEFLQSWVEGFLS